MFTTLMVVLALSGTEPHYAFEKLRDPFVPVFTETKTAPERRGYAEQRMRAAGFTREEIAAFFADPRLGVYPRLVTKNGTRAIDWQMLRSEMLSPQSVAAGVAYYRAHEHALRLGRERYGVRETSAVAIARIESAFGSYLYNPKNPHNVVVNIFYTKMLRTPKWMSAAESLVELLAYCKTNDHDCFAIKGSWAGAIGITQIMPFNLEEYGEDGDGDGRVDLVGSGDDALLSTMKFLAGNGYAPSPEGRLRGFARYYGSAGSYPAISLAYENLLEQAIKETPQESK